MTEQEEYIFGTKRYLKKLTSYCGNVSYEEFKKDEMRFDATCFAFEQLEKIVKYGKQFPEYVAAIGEDNVNYILKTCSETLADTYLDTASLYEFSSSTALKILMQIIANQQK